MNTKYHSRREVCVVYLKISSENEKPPLCAEFSEKLQLTSVVSADLFCVNEIKKNFFMKRYNIDIAPP